MLHVVRVASLSFYLQVSPSLSPVCSSALGVEGQRAGTPVIMCRSPTGNELQSQVRMLCDGYECFSCFIVVFLYSLAL